MTEPAHSKLGASSSHRWMECPGSIRMSAPYPDSSSVYAREGTAAHNLAEQCLRNKWNADRFLEETIVVGNDAFTVDEDMIEAVQVFLNTVRAILQPGDVLHIERRFNLEYIHEGMFGTCDVSIYRPGTGELFVLDYKHGKGIAVDVRANSQLRYYGLGAAISEQDLPLSDVHLYIVQPRAPHPDGPVRRDTISALDLLDWTEDLREAVNRTLAPDAPLKAGDWCKFCPAAGVCPALRDASIDAAKMEFATPGDMDPELMAEILEKCDLIEDWTRAVKAHAFMMLEHGAHVPGWKLVAKRPQRKWMDEEGAVRHLLGEGEVEEQELYSYKLKTPAQVEKLLPKTRRSELEAFYVKESSGYTLAREGDKREAVNIDQGSEFDAFS